jgi:hypothetical protein
MLIHHLMEGVVGSFSLHHLMVVEVEVVEAHQKMEVEARQKLEVEDRQMVEVDYQMVEVDYQMEVEVLL